MPHLHIHMYKISILHYYIVLTESETLARDFSGPQVQNQNS